MRHLLVLMSLFFSLFAETEFSEPIPSIMEPRHVILSIASSDEESINHVLSTANNVLKFYGPEKVKMRIVAYAGGIEGVLKKHKKIAERVNTLMLYEVTFVACENTMRTKKIAETELIDGTETVTAGIVEIIERVNAGWIYIKL